MRDVEHAQDTEDERQPDRDEEDQRRAGQAIDGERNQGVEHERHLDNDDEEMSGRA